MEDADSKSKVGRLRIHPKKIPVLIDGKPRGRGRPKIDYAKAVPLPRKRTISVATRKWLEANPEKKCGICLENFELNDWIWKKRMMHLNCADMNQELEIE